MIMGQSAGAIAALSLEKVSKDGAVHDVETAALHAALLAGNQLMNGACHLPPAPHVAEITVFGAGTASCNGVYKFNAANRRDPGTAFYTKDGSHQMYRTGGVWRIANGLHQPDYLWYTAAGSGQASPPTTGWKVAGKGVAPAPTARGDARKG